MEVKNRFYKIIPEQLTNFHQSCFVCYDIKFYIQFGINFLKIFFNEIFQFVLFNHGVEAIGEKQNI